MGRQVWRSTPSWIRTHKEGKLTCSCSRKVRAKHVWETSGQTLKNNRRGQCFMDVLASVLEAGWREFSVQKQLRTWKKGCQKIYLDSCNRQGSNQILPRLQWRGLVELNFPSSPPCLSLFSSLKFCSWKTVDPQEQGRRRSGLLNLRLETSVETAPPLPEHSTALNYSEWRS